MDPFPLMFNLESGVWTCVCVGHRVNFSFNIKSGVCTCMCVTGSIFLLTMCVWFWEIQQLGASLIRCDQLCINHVGRYMFSTEPDLLG